MAAPLYADIGDAINKVKFDVRVPDSYTPVIPGYHKKYPERKPFFQEEQPYSYSKMTCADIVDLCNEGIQFMICKREDVEIIVGMIRDYSDQLRKLVTGLPENSDPVIQLGRCDVALNVMQRNFSKAVRDRTQDDYERTGDTLQSILSKIPW